MNLSGVHNPFLRPWLPYALAAVVFTLTGILLYQSVRLEREKTIHEARLHVSDHLNQIRAAFEGNIYNNANLVQGLVAVIATEPDLDQKRFATVAKQLFKGRHQLRNIGGAPDLVIRLMYPLEGNEAAIGLDFRKNESQRQAALFAKEANKIILAGPVDLVQGGQAFIARLPVFVDSNTDEADHFWGLISTVIDINKLYQDSGLFAAEDTLDIALRGKDGTGESGDFFYGNPNLVNDQPVLARITLPYGEWMMLAVPKGGWPVQGDQEIILTTEILLGSAFIIISLLFVGRLLADRQGIVAELDNQKMALDEHAIVSIADVGGIITYVNDRFCSVSGYSRDELLGRNHRIIKSGEHPESFFEELWGTISSGKVWHGEIKNAAKDGTYYWVASTIVPFLNADGRPYQYIAVRTDITADKENEVALKLASAEAESATKAKSEFLASMSHEIRTPMTGILGYSDMLLDERLSPENAEMVSKIKEATASLLTIINDILDISKIEAGKLEIEKIDFRPTKIVNDVAQLFRQSGAADKRDKLLITTEIPDDFPDMIHADPTRLRQVLVNLVGNAVKFTEQGSVTLKCIHDADHLMLHYEITDTGIGIDDDSQAKLFGDFVQADASISRQYQGTGLGLAICKRLVELMGGEIGVKSQQGMGSTFWFNLPYEPAKSDFVIETSQTYNAKKFTGSRSLSILVAEDNEINQTIIQSILGKMGHETTVAADGVEAVEAIEASDFDLVLMDIRMPKMSGPDATKRIRRMDGFKSAIPIIALTADVMADNRQSYMDVGMNDCVGKPIDQAELAIAINKAIGETVNMEALENMENESAVAEMQVHFDFQETVDRLMLPPDVLLPLLQKFIDEYGDVDAAIRKKIDEKDFLGAAEMAHALKGVSGSLGAHAVFEHAAGIEAALRAEKIDELTLHMDALPRDLTQTIEVIRKCTDA